MVWKLSRATWLTSLSCSLACALPVLAGPPPLEQAMGLIPTQREVDYAQPTADQLKNCTIQAEAMGAGKGWVVRDAQGQILRKFVDTNGDNVVDQWCYYRDGLEIYRDIDTNYNGKVDQCRWLNTAGSRFGLDLNEDGKIDQWKTISAEEVSSEFVKALSEGDEQRFARLLLSKAELESLGLGEEKAKEIAAQLDAAVASFRDALKQQKVVTPKSQWLQFAATRPGIVPEGTEGSSKDLMVYENVVALIDSDGKHNQVPIGTLVQVQGGWRLVGMPDVMETETASSGSFFEPYLKPNFGEQSAGAPDMKVQELLAKLEKIDQQAATASDAQSIDLNRQRADLLEDLAVAAATDEERMQWRRQLADTVSAAVQSGGFPDGVERLTLLHDKLKSEGDKEELAAYVKFRALTADYGQSIQEPKADIAKVQDKWLASLEDFVKEYPTSPDTSEALLQLAIAKEFAGEEDEAKEYYGRIVTDFSQAPAAAKAAGAKTRLASVGRPVPIRGMTTANKPVDISQYRGKLTLVQYWATWCEPCKNDMNQIKDLLAKYGKSGFAVLGVNLDGNKNDLAAFLKQNPIPWVQIYEPGGLDSRPANEMGILTLPTMLLIDEKGNVVDRNIHIGQVEAEIKQRLKL